MTAPIPAGQGPAVALAERTTRAQGLPMTVTDRRVLKAVLAALANPNGDDHWAER